MKKNLFVLSIALIAGQAQAVKWQPKSINDPANFSLVVKSPMTLLLSQLPLEGKLSDDRLGWSETFWPSNKGGIAYRWNHPTPNNFKYALHTKEQLLAMTSEELSQLSPTELYDISQNDYKYSLTKKVLNTFNENKLWWEGICHGWALAASYYPEPQKVELTNKDGIQVSFGSSDVKGLLAMHEAFNSKGAYAQVGKRCGVNGKVAGEAFPEDGDVPEPAQKDADRPECSDTNAGAFHVVVTNMLGRLQRGFVLDVDRFNDVWNQPAVSFKSEVVGPVALNENDRKNGIAQKIQVKTKLIYGDELEFRTEELEKEGTLGFVSKEPVTNTPAQTFGEKNYEYILELDSNSNIVGGVWISTTRPDFIWVKNKDAKFTSTPGNGTGFMGTLMGLFKTKYPLEGLNQIYKPVVR